MSRTGTLLLGATLLLLVAPSCGLNVPGRSAHSLVAQLVDDEKDITAESPKLHSTPSNEGVGHENVVFSKDQTSVSVHDGLKPATETPLTTFTFTTAKNFSRTRVSRTVWAASNVAQRQQIEKRARKEAGGVGATSVTPLLSSAESRIVTLLSSTFCLDRDP